MRCLDAHVVEVEGVFGWLLYVDAEHSLGGKVNEVDFKHTQIKGLDDFELICWDVVSSPSTPGSYIGTQEELTQYLESDTTKEKKPKLNEKINRIKSILNS